MARVKQRGTNQECLLFHATDILGLRIARRISFAAGEDGVAMGTLQYCYESGLCIGYQLINEADKREDDDDDISDGGICAREMERNAFTVFRDGRSRTAGLSEEKRMERVARGLDAEDAIERTVAKVKFFEKTRTKAAPRIVHDEVLACP